MSEIVGIEKKRGRREAGRRRAIRAKRESKEWTERKRELRKELRKLRKGRISREEFWGKRKMYKEWCEEEREKYERREEEKIRMIKTQSEAWKYINRYGGRKQREKIDKSIEMKN